MAEPPSSPNQMPSTALLAVDAVERDYAMVGSDVVQKALRGVSLDVRRGEMVAIVGASGSGKSTLLYTLGCLDRPTRGSYRVRGYDVATLDIDARARLRGRVFGFVFQGFHLLPGLSAQDNVELPLLYRGAPKAERARRAREALAQVGLSDRRHHTPAQLSGGQQQRVAIARALVTDPEVLFADEPTGNLDTATTDEVLGLLQRLHAERGLTIVMVTHEHDVAQAAERIVTVRDGKIVDDTKVTSRRMLWRAPAADSDLSPRTPVTGLPATTLSGARATGDLSAWGMLGMGSAVALSSLLRSKLRTALTTLGILIGIAAVVVTTSLGAGAKARMEKEMMALGANMLMVTPNWGMSVGQRGGQGTGMTAADADAVARELVPVRAAAPFVSSNQQVVVGNKNVQTRITGTTPDYLSVRSWGVDEGRAFDDEDMLERARVCLIGSTVKRNVFPEGGALGMAMRVGRMPCTVVGVLQQKGQSGFGQDQDDIVIVPLSSYRAHIGRKNGDEVDMIVVSVNDPSAMRRAEWGITRLLRQRHKIVPGADDDFAVRNLQEMMSALDAQRAAISMLLLAIASVSLLVGGIGVMNIMLVSVTERTREIGIRAAIGARPIDVQAQFLLEAVVLSAVGGLMGLLLGAGAGEVLGLVTDYSVKVQPQSAALAVLISCAVGVVFGFFPARRAAGMDPITALRHE